MRLKEKMTERLSLNLCVRNGLLGVSKYKKRDVCEKSYSVNESCSRSWQDSTSPLPDICILPAAFTDFMNDYRECPLYLLTLLDQHRVLEPILNSYETFNLNAALIPYSVKSSYNIRSTRAKCCVGC